MSLHVGAARAHAAKPARSRKLPRRVRHCLLPTALHVDCARAMRELVDAIRARGTSAMIPQAPCSDQRIGTRTVADVLVVMAEHADHRSLSWPSLDTMATLLGFSRNEVYRARRVLVELGYITEAGKRGRGKAYHLEVDAWPDPIPRNVSVNVSVTVSGTISGSGDKREGKGSNHHQLPPEHPALPLLAGVATADDDEAETAFAGLDGVTTTQHLRKLLSIALRERGHTATTVNRHLRRTCSGASVNPMAVVTSNLRDIPALVVDATPKWKPWCGGCVSADYRFTGDPDHPTPCPKCSPQATAAYQRSNTPTKEN